MNELHGFKRGEERIHITHLSTHKKPVLLVGNSLRLQKIASFDSEECAKWFCEMLDEWFQAESEDKE